VREGKSGGRNEVRGSKERERRIRCVPPEFIFVQGEEKMSLKEEGRPNEKLRRKGIKAEGSGGDRPVRAG